MLKLYKETIVYQKALIPPFKTIIFTTINKNKNTQIPKVNLYQKITISKNL